MASGAQTGRRGRVVQAAALLPCSFRSCAAVADPHGAGPTTHVVREQAHCGPPRNAARARRQDEPRRHDVVEAQIERIVPLVLFNFVMARAALRTGHCSTVLVRQDKDNGILQNELARALQKGELRVACPASTPRRRTCPSSSSTSTSITQRSVRASATTKRTKHQTYGAVTPRRKRARSPDVTGIEGKSTSLRYKTAEHNGDGGRNGSGRCLGSFVSAWAWNEHATDKKDKE